MNHIIGIDLGTTNSVVSVIEGNQSVIIPNSEGKRTTPSIVGFLENNEKKVGDSAKRQMITNPDTIYSIKRLMGKKYSDVKNLKLPYKIIEGANEMAVVEIQGRKYTPQEISAMILQKMKKTAEDYLGTIVKDAVITVPAYFNDMERTATRESGEIAGLNVLRIINEPTAAALSYGMDKSKEDKKIVVFDIGGGTTDISVLELGSGVFETIAISGDVLLGGDNFDDMIIDFLADEFKKEYNIDLKQDKIAYQRLKEAAEKAKIELSSSSSTEINLPYIMPVDGIPKHLVTTLTRAKFEQMCDPLLKRIKEPCIKVLKDSGFKTSEIDEILLVGGSSRMPMAQQIAKEVFGKEPSKILNPDESVAIGASIQGGILSGKVDDVLLLDVIPISLGIETMGGVMTKLIDGNTTIPVSKSQIFSTASDNQPSVEIHVLQGERPMANGNKTLGRFHLDNLMPAPRGIPQINVEFSVDANGILEVTAEDKGTGKKQNIRIEGTSHLPDGEIERMKREAEENAEADKKAKEEIEILNGADSLIFQTSKQIKDFDDKLQDSEKTELEDLVAVLKESHNSKNLDKIKTDTQKLTEKWNVISTRIYQETDKQTQPDGQPKPDDNIKDVEFENVK
jgi:molecular chaperone DnaK